MLRATHDVNNTNRNALQMSGAPASSLLPRCHQQARMMLRLCEPKTFFRSAEVFFAEEGEASGNRRCLRDLLKLYCVECLRIIRREFTMELLQYGSHSCKTTRNVMQPKTCSSC